MAIKALPAREVLLQLLDYNPETGLLTWRERSAAMFSVGSRSQEHKAANWNSKHAATEAFSVVSPNGYKAGKLGRDRFYAHRLIWKMVYGADPEHIDHINGVRVDNRVANLRSVTRAENCRNARYPRPATCAAVGVYWHSAAKKWAATIGVNSTSRHLGLFDKKADAVAARKSAERELGYHPNHGMVSNDQSGGGGIEAK